MSSWNSFVPNNTIHLDGFAAYRLFDVVVKLKVCVRQDLLTNDPDQMKFIELLPRIRNANNDANTVEDWKFLLKNEYTIEKAKNFEGTHAIIMFLILTFKRKYFLKGVVRLFPENKKCNTYNQSRILSLKMPICKLKAICQPSSSFSKDKENFHGLRNILFLSINSKLTLVTNM